MGVAPKKREQRVCTARRLTCLPSFGHIQTKFHGQVSLAYPYSYNYVASIYPYLHCSPSVFGSLDFENEIINEEIDGLPRKPPTECLAIFTRYLHQ